jgi:large subunit ribosomal protein L23
MSLLSFTKKLLHRAPERAPQKTQAPVSTRKQEKQTPAQHTNTPAAAAFVLDPVVTEKSIRLQEDGIVAFRVPHTASKEQIAQVVRARYNVEVRGVRVVWGRPKARRRAHSVGRTPQWKKAYVSVDNVEALRVSP